MHRNSEGFTLVEVLVATVILTIMIGAALGLTTWVLRANAYSNKLTDATTMAQGKMDEILDGRFSSMASGNDTVDRFRRNWTVTPASYGNDVVVEVAWTDTDSHHRHIVLRTIVDEKQLGGF